MITKKIISTDSFLQFESDVKKCMESWQYLEPADTSPENRLKSDIEAYKKAFFDEKSPHLHNVLYDEITLVKLLIKNLKPAKHPVFMAYRDYLKQLTKPNTCWTNMYNELVKLNYIAGTTPETFTEVMEYKRISPQKNKIKWLTPMIEGYYLLYDTFGLSVKQINDCFEPKKGNFYKADTSNYTPPEPLKNIAETYNR